METSRLSLGNERGSAKVLTIVGILGLTVYLVFGFSMLHLPHVLEWGLVALLSVMTLFSLGYLIHMQVAGGQPKRELHRQIEAKAAELEKTLFETAQRERTYEHDMVIRHQIISRRGTECLANVKKIMRAMEMRLNDVKSLLVSGDMIDLTDAHDLLTTEKLEVGGSRMDTLLDAEPLPALAPFEWSLALDSLFEQIELEIEKAKEVQANYKDVA